MSVTTEIQRIQGAKTSLKSAIEAKGVTVPDGTLIDGYSDLVSQIETGSNPNLQAKTTTENGTVTPDAGYDGLSSVTVNVPVEGADLENVFNKYGNPISLKANSDVTQVALSNCATLVNLDLSNCTNDITNLNLNGCTSLSNLVLGGNVYVEDIYSEPLKGTKFHTIDWTKYKSGGVYGSSIYECSPDSSVEYLRAGGSKVVTVNMNGNIGMDCDSYYLCEINKNNHELRIQTGFPMNGAITTLVVDDGTGDCCNNWYSINELTLNYSYYSNDYSFCCNNYILEKLSVKFTGISDGEQYYQNFATNCRSLTEVHILNTNFPITIGGNSLKITNASTDWHVKPGLIVYVPQSLLSQYQALDCWDNFTLMGE